MGLCFGQGKWAFLLMMICMWWLWRSRWWSCWRCGLGGWRKCLSLQICLSLLGQRVTEPKSTRNSGLVTTIISIVMRKDFNAISFKELMVFLGQSDASGVGWGAGPSVRKCTSGRSHVQDLHGKYNFFLQSCKCISREVGCQCTSWCWRKCKCMRTCIFSDKCAQWVILALGVQPVQFNST